MTLLQMSQLSEKIRTQIVSISFEKNLAHVGSNLSMIEPLVFICSQIDPKHDRILLSKGHSALALYTVFDAFGFLHFNFDEFAINGGKWGVHPPLGGINTLSPFGSGSLGHGLGLGVGLALANKLQKKTGTTYVFLSDGELNEGSTWEAIMFASHHQLNNLVAVIDANAMQGLGRCKEVLDLNPLHEKLLAFGWAVSVIEDGHSFHFWKQCWSENPKKSKPRIFIANTIKGKGINRFEATVESHYLKLNRCDIESFQAKSDL